MSNYKNSFFWRRVFFLKDKNRKRLRGFKDTKIPCCKTCETMDDDATFPPDNGAVLPAPATGPVVAPEEAAAANNNEVADRVRSVMNSA